jgi:2-polyprenyl-3-methyl-5-hydroxy-6-metoxy-1,4-benzoquinol methylase
VPQTEVHVSAKKLNKKTQGIWDQIAPFWDEYMGEGGKFQVHLIGPATERLLQLKPGERVLDIACGNGAFSRRMAELGAHVVAFDFSEEFIQRAKARTQEHCKKIEYRVLDATDREQLLALGRQRFDAAVCTMALMDMAEIEPLMSALTRLLKSGGRFVFSVTHPCFNSSKGVTRIAEEEDKEGEFVTVYSVKISKYIRPSTAKGLGVVGQPVPHYYFHRPISMLFNTCFRAGFVLDGIEEPVFDEKIEVHRPLSWGANFKEIPPALVARMRLLKT